MALRVLWSLRAVFGGHFRVSVVSLGAPWVTFGPTLGLWVQLWPSWAPPGTPRASPGCRLSLRRAFPGVPGLLLGRPWAPLAPSWCPLGRPRPLSVSGWASQASLGHSWAPRCSLEPQILVLTKYVVVALPCRRLWLHNVVSSIVRIPRM